MATKTLAKIKAEMQFNSDLTFTVDAMKGVAAAQYYIMEHRRTPLEKIPEALEGLFKSYDFRRSRHPFVRMKNKKRLMVLVTTDSGFTGGLNMKVAQAALRYETSGTHYLVVGERGVNLMREFGKEVEGYPGITTDDGRFELVDQVVRGIYQHVVKGDYGQVIMVSPRAVSFTVQRVEVWNLVPCPFFFKDKSKQVPYRDEQDRKVILESKDSGIAQYLAVTWLRKRLIELFEDAKLAEFGARTMHLEEAYQTLKKQDKQLKLQFFKTRREKIDQSLRESFTAQLICK